MQIEELKSKIVEANKAYRSGSALMSDAAFDAMLDELKKEISNEEFISFQNTLHEVKGKVKHPFVMGSLDKMKTSEPKSIMKFLKEHLKTKLNVSAKVDGISCRLHYVDGILKSATTRGDGEFGEDVTDKIKFVKNVCSSVNLSDEIDIRGELVICRSDFETMTGFANPRNACAGIMNRKEWSEEDVSKVSFIAYTILGPQYSKDEQFELLEENGFTVAWHEDIDANECKDDAIVDKLFKFAQIERDYECDGLVISDSTYHNEDKYRPDAQRAVKINQLSAITRLVDVAWEGPSKNGLVIPVALIQPVELGGSTISRVTLHNLDFISAMGLKYGSRIEIIKSGDVIPKVVSLVENDNSCKEIELPTTCPCCQSELIRDGVNMRCMNHDCIDQVVSQLTQFIKKLGVKSASEKTLKNFGITSFDKLLGFSPNKKYKSEIKLYEEMNNKVFSRSREDIFYAMDFMGLSEIMLEKIVSYYTFDKIELFSHENTTSINKFYEICEKNSLPLGIGEITLQKFIEGIQEPISNTNKVIQDPRWHYSNDIQSTQNANQSIIGSICVTGSLKFGSRSKFLEFAKEHGYESKGGVSKGLTYLINNDISSTSSKNKKAKELGIKIITEDEFMSLVQTSSGVADLLNI